MRLSGIIGLLSLLIALAACQPKAELAVQAKTPWDTLPVLRGVSAFSGLDQDSAMFSAGAMRGHAWIASFFFTRCQTVCPALNNVLAGISREFATKVSFVSLTSDPENDVPSVMRAYAHQYGAQRATWAFVTMPIDSMIAVSSNDLGLISPSEPDLHSTRFVLIDTAMQVRGYYDSADPKDVDKLRNILKALP
jgi:protein SCO1/2